MTPFGAKVRELRAARAITLSEMAESLGVTPSYLSALEHGHRGRPTWSMIQRIIGYFNVIWDDAEDLQRLAATSDPRVVVDTSGLSPGATRLANRLAAEIGTLDAETIARLEAILEAGTRN
jgi:transcriptional regulator with XRE-family HTH domain